VTAGSWVYPRYIEAAAQHSIADEAVLPWGERKATGMISNGLAYAPRVGRRHGSSSQAR
jgi:hypothetical protein